MNQNRFAIWRGPHWTPWILCLLLLGGASAEPAEKEASRTSGINLLENGGFEQGGPTPVWWKRYPTGRDAANIHARDTSIFYSGHASARLTSMKPTSNRHAHVQWNRYGIAVHGGSVLSVAFHTKSERVAPEGAGCHFYDQAGNHVGFTRISGPDHAVDWTRVRQTVLVPASARKMGVALYAFDGGTTWYDDVSIVMDGPATERRKEWASRFKHMRNDTGAFHLVVTSSLIKIPRQQSVPPRYVPGEEPKKKDPRIVELEAARDETEAFQLVVIPHGDPLKDVHVTASDLVGPGGGTVPIDWNRVGYVKTAPVGYPVERTGWWPDPLLPPELFGVRADERQPLWFHVDVPPTTTAGRYEGTVTVRVGNFQSSVKIQLRVRTFRLPRPGTLATPFGLYASALAAGYDARAPYREVFSVEDYRRWCEFLGRRRLTPKNVAREYIAIEHGSDGYQVDLSALNVSVAPIASRLFAPFSFCLDRLPVATGLEKRTTTPDTQDWARRTAAIAAEWKRRGLPKQVYIYGPDEPHPPVYPILKKAYQDLRKVVPDYPIMQTIGDPNPQPLVGLVDIWCPLTPRVTSDFYQKRRKHGDTLWTYVCCSPKPPYANFFIDQPAIDHRVLFWQVRKVGATGLLYWSTTWWYGLPTPGAGAKSFPNVPIDLANSRTYKDLKVNGDGFLLYPGRNKTPYSSIRLEVIRDGIEDYEYLALLDRLLDQAKQLPDAQRPEPAVLDRAERLSRVPDSISRSMTDFTKQPSAIQVRRRAIAEMIEHLEGAIR